MLMKTTVVVAELARSTYLANKDVKLNSESKVHHED